MSRRLFDALTAAAVDRLPDDALDLCPPDAGAGLVGPALFDPQVNGYAGVDFQDPDVSLEALEFVADAVRTAGCSQFLLTLITNTPRYFEHQFRRLAEFVDRSPLLQKTVPGFHLEGPFLNPTPGFIGAHDPDCVRPPDVALFQRWQQISGNRIRMLTLGPEADGSAAFIRHVSATGVWVAAGHTDATAQQLQTAVAAGLRSFTHLGNGCPADLHRHDNVVHRALGLPGLAASLVPDGIHLPPAYLAQLTAQLGPQRLIATTDAMSAAGGPPGEYPLGDKRVTVGADRIVWDLSRRNFAGSSLTMVEGFFNLIRFGGLGVPAAWRAWTWVRERMFPDLQAPSLCLPFPRIAPIVEARG